MTPFPRLRPGPRAASRPNRRGFSLIEMLMVVVIIGTLTRIAIPNYQGMKRKAEAADVIGNFEVVKVAAFSYNADTHTWPPDYSPGQIPTELVNYLPENFSFTYRDYTLDWEMWILPDGLPKHPETRVLIGVSMVTEDADFANEVMGLLGEGAAHYTLGTNYTYVFEGI